MKIPETKLAKRNKEDVVKTILGLPLFSSTDPRRPGAAFKQWYKAQNEEVQKIVKSLKSTDFNHRIK